MKHLSSIRILSVIVALFLLTAVSSVAASAYSAQTYTITIESGSDVYTPDPALAAVDAGAAYTFSIPDDLPTTLHDDFLGDYEVAFSCWRFTGEYEVVEGTVNEDGESLDKTVVLRPLSDLKAVACFYEDNALFYMMHVDTNSDDYKPMIVQGECPKGEKWTFAVPDELEGFIGWEFEGDYEVAEGTVDENGKSKDKTVVLKPQSGIQAFARFEEPEEPAETSAPATSDQKSNTGKTSPKTADELPVILCVMLLGLAACAFSVKKIRE